MPTADWQILVTNDDGIDAPGLASLRDELRAIADVTVVAPAENQSGVGRTRNELVDVEEHPWGLVVEGTPADCVAYGLRGIDQSFDMVVAGVNEGPNTGNYVVGRSGTVGAGLEAAFLGVPAMAVSAYHSTDFFIIPPEEYDFARPARIATELVRRTVDAAVFGEVDLLNVNAPVDAPTPSVMLTEPYHDYEQVIEQERVVTDEGAPVRHRVRLHDRTWPGVVGWENPFPPVEGYRQRYPVGSDRRALVDAQVSVSPLSVTHGSPDSAALAAVIEGVEVA